MEAERSGLLDGIKWDVYSLGDPRSGVVRYVGITVDLPGRISAHMNDREKTPKGRWISELRRKRLRPVVNVLQSGCGRGASEAEKFWIANFRAMVGDALTNRSAGGYALRPGAVPLEPPFEPPMPDEPRPLNSIEPESSRRLFDLRQSFEELLKRANSRPRTTAGEIQLIDAVHPALKTQDLHAR